MRCTARVSLLTLAALACHMGLRAEVVSASNGSTTVTAWGTGNTREAAIQHALRVAVDQAIGGRLAAFSEVQNGRLAAHHVHFHSNGYVDRYEVIEEFAEDDQLRVRLRAEVRKGDGSALSGSGIDGRRLLSLAESRHHQQLTAGKLWTDLVRQWCERVAVARPVSTESSRHTESESTIELKQTVMLSVDQTRYSKAASELRTVLESVATAQGRFVVWMTPEPFPNHLTLWKSRLPHEIDSQNGMEWQVCRNVRSCRGFRVTSGGDNLLTSLPGKSNSILIFIDSRTSSGGSSAAWRWYLLPSSSAFRHPTAEMQVTLVDGQRREIERRFWTLPAKVPGYSWCPQTFGHPVPSIVLAPAWVAHSGTTSTKESLLTARSASLTVPISIQAERLSRVRGIECEVVTAPRWKSAAD